jgi:hypothetical protein
MTSGFRSALWHRRLRRCLTEIAVEKRANLVLPDDFEGWVHVQRLLLRPDGIHLIEVLEGRGQVIAGDVLPDWTIVGRRRFVFPNPLPELERKLASVRSLVGQTPVSALLVMGAGLEFARARPRKVIPFSELPERLHVLAPNAVIRADYREAWEQLLAVSHPGRK